MNHIESRATQRVIDLGVLSIAFWSAFLLRFDGDLPLQYLKRALFLWPYVVVLQYITLAVFRVPAFSWRYIGLRDVSRILGALSACATLLLTVRLVTGAFFTLSSPAGYLFIPIGVILIDYVLAFIGIAGVRGLRRLLVERFEVKNRSKTREITPTLLIGAGQAGLLTAREIERQPQLGLRVVGFVDDDHRKVGQQIHGIRVLGTTSQLGDIVADQRVAQAIITIASASGEAIRRIRERCEAVGLMTKIVPGIHEILDGRVNLSRIREVSIEDLLRRDVVELETERVIRFLHGRRILVTGAGGSIGSEIVRQVAHLKPGELYLLDRSEPALFAIHHELRSAGVRFSVTPVLADICDQRRIRGLFERIQPEVVFHAAAHKHVPMAEWNPGEALKNNVFGTKIVADAAHDCGSRAFVQISTDKAVNPTSIMGASKRVAELYAQARGTASETTFVAVRFGNVLGSTGSVVPIFKEQIAAGGPVTVTHPDMKRYFMTIPEATALVLQAASIGQGGEIFVLDMGEPVRILDLASDLIELSGFRPHDDIRIEFTGVRPGEKLFEELGFDGEQMDRTVNPKIFVLTHSPQSRSELSDALRKLEVSVNEPSPLVIRQALQRLVPELQDPEPMEPRSQGDDRPGLEAERAGLPVSGPLLAASGAAE